MLVSESLEESESSRELSFSRNNIDSFFIKDFEGFRISTPLEEDILSIFPTLSMMRYGYDDYPHEMSCLILKDI